MNPRAFDTEDEAVMWSAHGGVAYALDHLWGSHEQEWLYAIAGQCGVTFARTLDRGSSRHRVYVPEGARERVIARCLPRLDRSPTPTVVVFSGTRHGLTESQAESLRAVLYATTISIAHDGLCVGADAQFHTIMLGLGMAYRSPYLVGWPADVPERLSVYGALRCDSDMPKAQPLHRNLKMLLRLTQARTERPDHAVKVIACPFESVQQNRGGTWHVVRHATSLGLPVTIVQPDGTVTDGNGVQVAVPEVRPVA